jgi:hypothetical protein
MFSKKKKKTAAVNGVVTQSTQGNLKKREPPQGIKRNREV